MELQDRSLTCRDCGNEFVFTAGEQGFYIEKGLMNLPQRCPACRTSRRSGRNGATDHESTINCAQCGKVATVPFVPRLDRPVYCGDCFAAMRSEQTAVSA